MLDQKNMNNNILIMDNCVIHKITAVWYFIQGKGHVADFLPPYSLQLNPIEEVFSKGKYLIKQREPNNIEDLMASIQTTHTRIT